MLIAAISQASAQQYAFLPVPGSPRGVAVLFQDSHGRLWLGGPELACFDGARFFFLRDYGFPHVESYDIAEDPSGAIWIGAETGVYRFAEGRVDEIAKGVAVSIIPTSPDFAIAAIGPIGKGVPVSTSSLIRIRRINHKWTSEPVMELASPGPLALDHGGWVLCPWPERGWIEFRVEDIVRWRATGKPALTRHALWAFPGAAGKLRVLRDRSGCVWVGTLHETTYDCGDGIRHRIPLEDGGRGANFREASDGSILLVDYTALAVGRPGSFRVAKLKNGLPVLLSAIQAQDGTIWLGTPQGLYRFASPFRLEYWTVREGVKAAWCVRRRGQDMYAGLNRDVAALSKDRQRWQKLASFDGVGEVAGLLSTTDGSLIAALNPGGAVMLRPDGAVIARTFFLHHEYGLRLALGLNQQIWLAGVSVMQLKREASHLTFQNHHLETQPAGNVLDVQYEDQTHKLWACYNGGLVARSGDGSWREITTKEGLLVNGCWSLAALPNGDVWYGYYETPAFALIRQTAEGRVLVRQFRAGGEVLDPESITFDTDQRGWLWRGGNHGMSAADPSEAEARLWLHFDQFDGFPADAVNSGSYFADSDGSIWWGADNNIVHYNPSPDLVDPHFSPQIFVSAFSSDSGAPKLAEATAPVPHGSKTIAHIGSLQFDRRSALHLRYRVLPGQPAWRESKVLDLSLGALGAGAHTLEVQGRVFTGPWSATASRSFTVLRGAWLAWPLLGAYFVTTIGLATGGYLFRRSRLADAAQLLPDLAAWRMGALLPEVHELVGTVLDSRFAVGDLLARGGFANVFSGYDRAQRQRCAIKVFRGEIREQDWIRRRFAQEVAALQRIRHPNVVAIYAHGTAPSGAPYLVMEFIEGRNLREVLEDGALPPRRASQLLRQLASALDAVHAQGICHRDVKPENIIIRTEGSLKEELVLIDFSIAIVKDSNETLHGLSRAAGSFDYMAPEQAIGYAEPSSDVYSLAKLLVELLTGKQLKDLLPDAALDLPDRVRDLVKGLGLNLSPASIGMVATALEFDPLKRPRTAGQFAAPLVNDLESCRILP